MSAQPIRHYAPGLQSNCSQVESDDLTYLYPHLYMPENAQPFDIQGLITTPNIGVTTAILTYTSQPGFKTVIKRLTHNIVGAAFVQGSGDLVWRLQINSRPVRGYGNMLIEFGSLPPSSNTRYSDGIILQPGETLTYLVFNNAYAVVSTQVVASISGWQWISGQ